MFANNPKKNNKQRDNWNSPFLYCRSLLLVFGVYLQVADAGETIFVHAFGCYFGLAVSYVMSRRQLQASQGTTSESLKGSSYTSDIFAMMGKIFNYVRYRIGTFMKGINFVRGDSGLSFICFWCMV